MPLSSKDQNVLVRLLTDTEDEEVVRAIKYVLNTWQNRGQCLGVHFCQSWCILAVSGQFKCHRDLSDTPRSANRHTRTRHAISFSRQFYPADYNRFVFLFFPSSAVVKVMQATAGNAGLINLRCHVANKFKALICPCDALVHGLILLLECQLLLQWLETFASLKTVPSPSSHSFV